MAFKNVVQENQVVDSPDKLFRELSRRRIPDVLPHQAAMMQAYAAKAQAEKDVALQLPTGSGKTLVGLLIAEWRRRKNQEKVVYLCPTKQLVNQVVNQAHEKYGMSVTAFTGKIKDYPAGDKAAYRSADKIAVTTYSSLFNTNPFFTDADVVIVDDAHAAEAYVANTWSVQINRLEHAALHEAMRGILNRFLNETDVARLAGQTDTLFDHSWTEMLPTVDLLSVSAELNAVLDTNTAGTDLRFPWSMLRDHLHACQLYMSSYDILLRPLIPPTWSHSAFSNPIQRIYMSATLGESGDLERLLGRRSILRLPIPEGWERQGVGRRFFIFPDQSLKPAEVEQLTLGLMKIAGRTLVLVPSDAAEEKVAATVAQHLGFPTLNAMDIELSKAEFISKPQAVAAVANRYDGIDFPGDECRLLIVEGLPKAMNLQERFLMSRVGANLLFNERVQTRVLQAIGRCTRSLEDYSAVVVTGSDLPDYLSNIKRRRFFHPELQAELAFGIDQSKDTTVQDLLDNLNIFLNERDTWEKIDQQIVAKRKVAVQQRFPAIAELRSVVEAEVRYQEEMWRSDYEAAAGFAQSVLGGLQAQELKGYRALWHYLCGSAYSLAAAANKSVTLEAKAREQYAAAKSSATSVPWLVRLASRYENPANEVSAYDPRVIGQVERIETLLERLGTQHDRRFAAKEKFILEGIAASESNAFEEAQKQLGELLGFVAGNEETDGAPDPWWIADDLCIVFEDHSDAQLESALHVTKARQAATHPSWIRTNVPRGAQLSILPVLVTPVQKMRDGASPHLESVALWAIQDFREWARQALATVRELRTTFMEPGDLEWRARAIEALQSRRLDASGLFTYLQTQQASALLENVR